MSKNKLKINEEKTEIMPVGSMSKVSSNNLQSINVCGKNVTPSPSKKSRCKHRQSTYLFSNINIPLF